MREDISKLSVDPEELELEVASSSRSSPDDDIIESVADISESDGHPMSSSCSSRLASLLPLLLIGYKT
jgi:hypothetical protein